MGGGADTRGHTMTNIGTQSGGQARETTATHAWASGSRDVYDVAARPIRCRELALGC